MPGDFTVVHGDCRAVLEAGRWPADSFHSIVTDPPYGIGFMGADWDHGIPGAEFWREALRVARPGAHLAAFSSPRTYHRLTCAIEDAGWEIRDGLIWLYGTGAPKGLDVAKAIDKRRHDRAEVLEVCAWVRARRDELGLSNAAIDAAFGFVGMAGHWTSRSSQPAVPTLEQVPGLLTVLRVSDAELPDRIRHLLVSLNGRKGEFGAAWHARDVTGTVEEWTNRTNYALTSRDGLRRDHAHSADAKAWEGWNTALKPGWEPIVLARKPITGTIATNILEYGTGALNIGACRVGGRWPANVLLDGEAAEMLDEMSGDSIGGGALSGNEPSEKGGKHTYGVLPKRSAFAGYDDFGGASRFFYTAKADSEERHAGCESLFWRIDAEGVPHAVTPAEWAELEPDERRRGNPHPTVKPLDLMRWVTRLVTPPAGHVLDMFAGSGSTLAAGVADGFNVSGIELQQWAVTVAEARAAHYKAGGAIVRSSPLEPQQSLFDTL